MRNGLVVCLFVLAAGLLLDGDLAAGSLEPPGPPAPTMKTLQQVESRVAITTLPFTISAPGSYYLTGDLTGISGGNGVIITTSFVTLDLNGFSLIGVPGSATGIQVPFSARHIKIRNGLIRGWGASGVAASTSTDVQVEDLRVAENLGPGLFLGSRSTVRNTSATGNGGDGIATGVNSTITGCTAGSNSSSGFALGTHSLVSGSTASANGTNGFLLSSASLATDCMATQNGIGFLLQSLSTRVVHSVAYSNSTGFAGGDGVEVEDCTAEANTDDGIRIQTRGVARHNFARGNANDGIQATGNDNRIEENQTNGNSTGLRVGGINNLVVRNSTSNNSLEFSIAAGNKLGPISADPATAGPWANFDQ